MQIIKQLFALVGALSIVQTAPGVHSGYPGEDTGESIDILVEGYTGEIEHHVVNAEYVPKHYKTSHERSRLAEREVDT